jgi:hypothetical protein
MESARNPTRRRQTIPRVERPPAPSRWRLARRATRTMPVLPWECFACAALLSGVYWILRALIRFGWEVCSFIANFYFRRASRGDFPVSGRGTGAVFALGSPGPVSLAYQPNNRRRQRRTPLGRGPRRLGQYEFSLNPSPNSARQMQERQNARGPRLLRIRVRFERSKPAKG